MDENSTTRWNELSHSTQKRITPPWMMIGRNSEEKEA
jgi:hypothetical protein